jgi:hypothetical protein
VTWLFLIYTIPSEPSRKRAAVWREIKKAGAIYVRDGVATLPERAETRATFQAIAVQIEALDGHAVLAKGARLDPQQAAAVVAQAQANRAEEYAEIVREAEQLLAHMERERAHRELTSRELAEAADDLCKLRRWTGQVRARDYFHADREDAVDAALDRCERALAAFVAEAERRGTVVAA